MRARLIRLFDEVTDPGPILPTAWLDWALAAVAGLAVVVEVVAEPDLRLLRLAVGVGTAAFVPFRRQQPLLGVGVALVLHVVLEAIGRRTGLGGEATTGQILAGILLLYALCRWDRPERVVAGTVFLVGILVGTEYLIEAGTDDVSFVASWLALACFAVAMRYRSVMVDQRDRRVRIAERHALARDVHDSVAHHVSAIAVHAQAARYVAGSDPRSAAEAMARVEDTAGQTVDELRRLVAVLRADDDTTATPAPASLLELADADGHPPVVVEGEPDLTTLPASLATGIYRLAQEAITNARRHGRQATVIEVSLRRSRGRLVLQVLDDGASPGPIGTGYGLVGMRERAVVLGGKVTYGPRPASGWRVEAVLPLR